MIPVKVKWSHSSLKDFEGCARRYHEVKVLKKFPFQDTVQTRYGKDLHKAAEDYIQDDTPLPEQFAFVQPTLDSLKAKTGRKFVEYEMALTEDLNPCAFDSENVWVRGIADLIIVNDDNFTARVVDYKTGNDRYPDRDQLILMSLMVFKHFPHIKRVKSALLFVVKKSMVTHEVGAEEQEQLWWRYRERVARLAASHSVDVWNPNQTPLCGWCPVTDCEHHPQH
jgi:RecB family exonuclease